MAFRYDDVDKFIDRFDKIDVSIRPESINITVNKSEYHFRNSFRSNVYPKMLLECMDGYKDYLNSETVDVSDLGDIKRKSNKWGDDFRLLLKIGNVHGVIAHSDGLLQKYQECLDDLNKITGESTEIKEELTRISTDFARVIEEKDELLAKNYQLKLKNAKLEMENNWFKIKEDQK